MNYLSLSRFLFLLFTTFLSCFACAEDTKHVNLGIKYTKHVNLGTTFKYYRFEIEYDDDKNLAAYITPESLTTDRYDALRPIRFTVTPLSLLPGQGQNLRLLLRPVINPNAGADPQLFDLSNYPGFTITVADKNHHGSDSQTVRQTELHIFQILRVFTPSILEGITHHLDPERAPPDVITAPVPAQLNLNDAPVELRGKVNFTQSMALGYKKEGQEEELCYSLGSSIKYNPDLVETATFSRLDAKEIEVLLEQGLRTNLCCNMQDR